MRQWKRHCKLNRILRQNNKTIWINRNKNFCYTQGHEIHSSPINIPPNTPESNDAIPDGLTTLSSSKPRKTRLGRKKRGNKVKETAEFMDGELDEFMEGFDEKELSTFIQEMRQLEAEVEKLEGVGGHSLKLAEALERSRKAKADKTKPPLTKKEMVDLFKSAFQQVSVEYPAIKITQQSSTASFGTTPSDDTLKPGLFENVTISGEYNITDSHKLVVQPNTSLSQSIIPINPLDPSEFYTDPSQPYNQDFKFIERETNPNVSSAHQNLTSLLSKCLDFAKLINKTYSDPVYEAKISEMIADYWNSVKGDIHLALIYYKKSISLYQQYEEVFLRSLEKLFSNKSEQISHFTEYEANPKELTVKIWTLCKTAADLSERLDIDENEPAKFYRLCVDCCNKALEGGDICSKMGLSLTHDESVEWKERSVWSIVKFSSSYYTILKGKILSEQLSIREKELEQQQLIESKRSGLNKYEFMNRNVLSQRTANLKSNFEEKFKKINNANKSYSSINIKEDYKRAYEDIESGYVKALRLIRQEGSGGGKGGRWEAEVTYLLSFVQSALGQYSLAVEFGKSSLLLWTKIKQTQKGGGTQVLMLFQHLAENYIELGQYEVAEEYLKQGIKIGEEEKAGKIRGEMTLTLGVLEGREGKGEEGNQKMKKRMEEAKKIGGEAKEEDLQLTASEGIIEYWRRKGGRESDVERELESRTTLELQYEIDRKSEWGRKTEESNKEWMEELQEKAKKFGIKNLEEDIVSDKELGFKDYLQEKQ